MNDKTALEKARAAWSDEMPEWIRRLACACDETSQAKVALKIDLSTAYVSHAINRIDPRAFDPVKEAFELVFNDQKIKCPILGDIDFTTCKSEYSRPFSAANSQRVRQFKSCQKCQHNRSKQ